MEINRETEISKPVETEDGESEEAPQKINAEQPTAETFREIVTIESPSGWRISVGSHSTPTDTLCGQALWLIENAFPKIENGVSKLKPGYI